MAVTDLTPKPRPLAVLRSSTLLNVLNSDEMEVLAASCRIVRAERGQAIWLNGGDVDFIGLPADGWIKMVRHCPSGASVTVEIFGPGQIFGLMGALTGTGCPLSACAVTDLWYLRIPKRVILDLNSRSIPLKDRLLRNSAFRLHSQGDLMAKLSSKSVEARIAAILFLLAESYGVQEPLGMRLQVPLTRQEIGEMAGTTVESTIRVMSRWQKEGLILTDHQHVIIVDESGLVQALSR